MKKIALFAACMAPLLGSCVLAIGNDGFANNGQYVLNVKQAICVIQGTEGNENVHGTVTFTQREGGVFIEAHLTGLAPGAHGFHVHQYGDLSTTDGKSAGGHYNPENHEHSGPSAKMRHEGDLGNIVADASGVAEYSRFDEELKLVGKYSILGRGMIIHAGEDDQRSQPTGNAGARVGYGVIGIAKPK